MATSTVPQTYDKGASTAVPLGTVQGGVWRNDNCEPRSWGCTCPACCWWQTHYVSPEASYAALRVHQRRNCQARRDGGDQ